ncbi:MAG: hypothetical protein DLM63_09080 [Solirubrobacterales bacterium]|nr:MAG: hypothetical protein DLM63_09080 [Solirubrobacterales bacterium]
MDAVRAGQRVTLTVHGEPVADIVPHGRRTRWLGGAQLREQLGVLSARDDAIRARRADTLALARTADPIALSGAVMVAWARLVADCRAVGTQRNHQTH